MDNNLFLLAVTFLLCIQVSSQNCNDVNSINDIDQVHETDAPGTLIFNVSKGPLENITFTITNPIEPVMQSYFRHFQNDTLFTFSLNKTLDLEELYNILGYDVQAIDFNFFCGTILKRTTVYVIPENEYSPSINITGDLNIPENTTVGSVVYKLRERVLDKDRPKSTTFSFDLTSTGEKTFALVGALTGDIKLDLPLDFESGHNSYILNISVKDTIDSTARTGYALLRVNILDVDDQGPEFVVPGCSSPCVIPEYTAITELSYTGPLTVEPAAIKARDLDTLNLPIAYSIYNDPADGSSSNVNSGFFKIESSNGTIFQLRPASQALWATKRLVVRAAEVGSSQPAAHATVTVRVRQRDPTINGTMIVPGEGRTVTEKDVSLLSAVIAISVLFGVSIIAAAIVIFLMRRKRREIVSPEDTNSEPPTEEEEIHSERSEEASFRKRIVLSTTAKTKETNVLNSGTDPITDPTFLNRSIYRHMMLPPLPMKDTGIGTDSTKAKKRSRRRLKKKENEMFDGTREYDMKADPEFFESPDKSKIKRSTRSFKAPTKHIVVNNDNAELED
ncbi:hypothetical protein CHS0354_039477 [Potamilus streckersoni]|uniref:Cadherin domain-containing protein n=1 Tax=Potamilus streckersoni TaxID=2493646 RepID=A0AAE0WEE2_9BIVA|nr:hypothetical protein CHS0354_039477 [Potamilus streckersoni]